MAAIAAIAAAIAPQVSAAEPLPGPRPSPIAIVVDTSDSMNEEDGSGRIKINGAKIALLDFLGQVEPDTPVGLRTYPYPEERGGGECSPGELRVSSSATDRTDMAATIRTLTADGDTPTAAALKAAEKDLTSLGSGQGGTIVLVSDGESNCGPDPCDTAREIAESGFDLQTITVGFRVSGAGAKELQCIAEQTEGRYLSVHDNAGLAEAFDEISRPELRLEVDYPTRVTAQVGNDPSGLVKIEAKVSNPSQHLARGVVTRIRFDVASGAPAVIRPVVHLGNLEPGDSRKVSWVFRPGVPPRDRNPMKLRFTVIAGAENTLADAEFKNTIDVYDAFENASEAGPILSSRHKIAIVGDSFSAGEGADFYIGDTDTDANPCHRSRFTYLVEVFDLDDSRIIACSGAVAADVTAAQEDRTVGPQEDQLEALRRRAGVDAVVLTLGGNDVGFGKIAASCLFGRSDCSDKIYEGAPFWQWSGIPTRKYLEERIGGLASALRPAYRAINGVVNGPQARGGHGPVPILVLAYPMPTPLTPQDCPEMWDLLSPGEIKLLNELVIDLNGMIEGTVKNAWKYDHVPAFFVPNTEMAFQPDHTLCDRDPYARTLDSFNGAGVDAKRLNGVIAKYSGRSDPIAGIKRELELSDAKFDRTMRAVQELVHPNQLGYAAETRAVLRWSQSPAAMGAVKTLESAPIDVPAVVVVASGPELGQLVPGETPTLQGGTSYPLQAGGFAPDSPLTIGVHSEFQVLSYATADGAGEIATRIAIPEGLDPGDHTLTVSGVDADGQSRTVEIPFDVAGGGLPTLVSVLLWLAVAGTLAAGLLLAGLALSRRRGPRPTSAG